MSGKRKYISVSVDVGYHSEDVPLEEIMESISTEDLRAELEKRQHSLPVDLPLDNIERALLANRPNEALILLQRVIGHRDFEINVQSYELAKANRDPETGRPLIA